MAFDLSAVMASALESKAQQENNNNGGSKGPKLLYPQDGTLRVKLLFNPASGLVSRKILRHTVEGTKAACLSAYGVDCPICNTVTSIQNSKGIDLWKLKAATRGISFAQYISSDYKWDKPEYAPKEGEVVLLMYPWTIYQDINRIIADAGQMASTVVASNSGKIVKISRWNDKGQVKYKAEIDAFAGDFTSCNSEDEFNNMLTTMESLNDKIVPATITDALTKQAREVSEQLTASYLGNQIVGNPQASGLGYNPQPMTGAPVDHNTQHTTYSTYQQPVANQPTYQQPVANQPTYQQPVANQPTYQSQQPATHNYGVQPNSGFAPADGFGAGFAPTAPTAPAGASQMTQPNKPANAPDCYGCKNSGNIDPNKCLICPHELMCSQN